MPGILDMRMVISFERRRCESDGQWRPEAPNCTETLCKTLSAPDNGHLVLTTLRIGGQATFTCDHGYGLKGDDDIECLSSGSWSAWPPLCVEIDCGKPDDIDNGRTFLVNGTTVIGSILEYHCFPGYERQGPFERHCALDGYWSGLTPSCTRPRPITILSDNTVDGTKNVRAGSSSSGRPRSNSDATGAPDDTSSVGMWIGIILALIVVVGIIVIVGYFYRKQRAIPNKSLPPTTSASAGAYRNGGAGGAGVYNAGGNAPTATTVPARIGQRPPPPIQMYSMEDGGSVSGGGGGSAGPIYDTINDDSSGSSYVRSNNGSEQGSVGGYAPPTTFSPQQQSSGNGLTYPRVPPVPPPQPPNVAKLAHASAASPGVGGGHHEYDVPEGSDNGSRPGSQVGAVTINGIAV